MKKLLFIFGITLAMIACNGKSTVVANSSNDSIPTDTFVDVADSSLIDTITIK